MQEPSFTNFQAYFGSRRPFLWSVNWLFCRPCRPRNSDAFWGTVQVLGIPKDARKIIKRQRLGQLGVASQLLKLWQIWWWSLPDLEELCFKHWKLKVYQLVCIYLDSKCWSAKTSNFPQGYTGEKKSSDHLVLLSLTSPKRSTFGVAIVLAICPTSLIMGLTRSIRSLALLIILSAS